MNRNFPLLKHVSVFFDIAQVILLDFPMFAVFKIYVLVAEPNHLLDFGSILVEVQGPSELGGVRLSAAISYHVVVYRPFNYSCSTRNDIIPSHIN